MLNYQIKGGDDGENPRMGGLQQSRLETPLVYKRMVRVITRVHIYPLPSWARCQAENAHSSLVLILHGRGFCFYASLVQALVVERYTDGKGEEVSGVQCRFM